MAVKSRRLDVEGLELTAARPQRFTRSDGEIIDLAPGDRVPDDVEVKNAEQLIRHGYVVAFRDGQPVHVGRTTSRQRVLERELLARAKAPAEKPVDQGESEAERSEEPTTENPAPKRRRKAAKKKE